MKLFKRIRSTLTEDGEFDADVTHTVQSRWTNWKWVYVSVVLQASEREHQGRGIQGSGTISTGRARARKMGCEEDIGTEIVGRRNDNSTMDERSYDARKNQGHISWGGGGINGWAELRSSKESGANIMGGINGSPGREIGMWSDRMSTV